MTDYLIEAATKEEWAERALRAEAKLRDMALDCLAAEGQAADAYQAQLAAEAKLSKSEALLAKAVEALEYYAAPPPPPDVDDSLLARAALAELKAETDGF
jgi:hypothetical protein